MDSTLSLDLPKEGLLFDFPIRVVSTASETSDTSLSASPPLSPYISRTTSYKWDGERPAHHRKNGKGYENPWASATKISVLADFVKNPFTKVAPIPEDIRALEAVMPSFQAPYLQADKIAKDKGTMSVTWLGHASVLAQFPGSKGERTINIMFDPVFSERASPFSFIGPKRRIAAPLAVEQLPEIDYVCLSHNHYDHLDKRTTRRFAGRPGKATKFLVPLGNSAPLRKAGVPSHLIYELDWWDAIIFPRDSPTHDRAIRITCTPAQHGSCGYLLGGVGMAAYITASGRTLFDFKYGLWSSWVVEHVEVDLPVKRMFFGGDTGYRAQDNGPVCPAFVEIGERFPNIDVACVPIWRGACLSFISKFGLRLKPEAFTRAIHATPKDAVVIHKDLGAKQSIAIHHGTFVGSQDEALWSIQLLREACNEAGVRFQQGSSTTNSDEKPWTARTDNRCFSVLDVGQSIIA